MIKNSYFKLKTFLLQKNALIVKFLEKWFLRKFSIFIRTKCGTKSVKVIKINKIQTKNRFDCNITFLYFENKIINNNYKNNNIFNLNQVF